MIVMFMFNDSGRKKISGIYLKSLEISGMKTVWFLSDSSGKLLEFFFLFSLEIRPYQIISCSLVLLSAVLIFPLFLRWWDSWSYC